MREPAKTREKLLETAIALVWQSNYCSVGVEEICQRAGVTKGAFYHHFESKADLFYEAAKHEREVTRGDWEAIFSHDLDPLEQLERLIAFLTAGGPAPRAVLAGVDPGRTFEVTGCPFFSAGGQVGLEETKVRQAAVEMAEHAVRDASAFVGGLKTGGYLNGDPDVEQIGRMAFMFVQGLLIYARAHNSRAIVEADLRDGLYRILDLKADYRREAAPKEHGLAKAPAAAGL